MRKRGFLVSAVLLILALPLLMGAASSRSYVSGNNILELDGVRTGFVKSVQGGRVYAEVINEPVGPDSFIRKHIGQPRYEEFQVQVGFSMARPVYDWISESWLMHAPRKNGAVIATDSNNTPTGARQFYNALITETTIPAIDGASKEPAYITLKFAPEYTRNAKAADTKSAETPKAEAQKTWLPSNFRLEIDGLDTSKVNKIDSFTVKQTAVQDSVGDARDTQREPGKLEFPNLKITLSSAGADGWYQWLEDFVLLGNNGQDQEKNGTLYFLSTDRKTVLAQIRLYNMGILSIRTLNAESGSDAVERVQAEVYVERMEFSLPDQK